jgi:hypothetical protein
MPSAGSSGASPSHQQQQQQQHGHAQQQQQQAQQQHQALVGTISDGLACDRQQQRARLVPAQAAAALEIERISVLVVVAGALLLPQKLRSLLLSQLILLEILSLAAACSKG